MVGIVGEMKFEGGITMAFDLDDDELRAIRKSKGLDDGLYEEKAKLVSQIATNFGIDFTEAKMMIEQSLMNFGKEFNMSTETSDKNVVSEEEKLMKSLEYELDRIIEKSSKVETAAEIAYLRQQIILMFLKLLKEREQDKKRIQELEECKIVQDKNIRSGKPVIEGTRLTVIDVLLLMIEFIKKHEKEFREDYADISSKQIVSSINYLLENSIPKQKVKDLKESIILPNTIVGGRRNGKTLEYGIKLGKIKAYEELLEGGK